MPKLEFESLVVKIHCQAVNLFLFDAIKRSSTCRESQTYFFHSAPKTISMNFISLIFWIVEILSILIEIESLGDEIIEKFYYSPLNNDRDVQWEFLIIGKRVPWNIAKMMCKNRDSSITSDLNFLDLENISSYTNFSGIKKDTKFSSESKLAILEEDKLQIWLSRMLAESDYRYDGLWVGGHKINSTSNWTWIGMNENEEIVIPSSPIISNYPEWYKSDNNQDIEKNCLLFDRIGHNMPILVPSDCNQRKPFVCSRLVRKKYSEKIIEGIGIYVDGYRYTVYSVDSDDYDEKEMENTSGIRKLNGGGIKWRDARVECRKRGKYLATVLSNEAAAGIASIMLKNRPSMESAWLGGWSPDGTEWTWSSTGFSLSLKKSQTTQYPPWLSGHPLTSSNLNEFSGKRGRCLILDRHLCPDHINPVFLDLNCEKKRPFVCQDAMPRRSGFGNRETSINRNIIMEKKILKFSTDRMTWNEGRQYCANNFGRIASILDSKTLSAILDKMIDLDIDHIWVGGKTEKTNEGWKWFDETGKPLSRKGIGAGSSWCLGDDDDNFPKADADNCLNLDREGHGLPLFYGLRCDYAKQHVLCIMDHGSRSLSISTTDLKKNETKIDHQEKEIDDLSSRLVKKFRDIASYEKSAIFFVIDDSPSVINSWLIEELKFVSIVLQNLFPLSPKHPMGLLSFSQSSKFSLALNQTNICSVNTNLGGKFFDNREIRRNAMINNYKNIKENDDFIRAVSTAVDIVNNSFLQRVTIVFIVDEGNIKTESINSNQREILIKKLKILKNSDNEIFALIVGEGLQTSINNSGILEIFEDYQKNLFFTKSFLQLGKIITVMNSTTSRPDNHYQCAVSS